MLPIKNLIELVMNSLGRGFSFLKLICDPQANPSCLRHPLAPNEGSTARLYRQHDPPEGAMDAASPELPPQATPDD
jgi:hypothetical protein